MNLGLTYHILYLMWDSAKLGNLRPFFPMVAAHNYLRFEPDQLHTMNLTLLPTLVSETQSVSIMNRAPSAALANLSSNTRVSY